MTDDDLVASSSGITFLGSDNDPLSTSEFDCVTAA